jgi:hypothetical protein
MQGLPWLVLGAVVRYKRVRKALEKSGVGGERRSCERRSCDCPLVGNRLLSLVTSLLLLLNFLLLQTQAVYAPLQGVKVSVDLPLLVSPRTWTGA